MQPAALEGAFRPAARDDLSEVLALRKAVIGGSVWWDDDAYVRWRYFELRADTEPIPYWVFKKDGQIIGVCGLEPVLLAVDGETQPAVRTLDIMVRPDFEGRGLGAFMNVVLFRHFPIAMVTGSNARSHKLISRMFRHLLDLRCWKAAVQSREVLEHRLGAGQVAAGLARVVDPLLEMERRLRRRRLPRRLAIRELTGFEDDVTELSRRCERRGRIQVRRSADYLNWRFVKNPRCRYRLLGGFLEGRLAGYLVTRFNVAKPDASRDAEIVDWLAEDEGPAVLPFLIQEALEQFVRAGARVVSCVGFDDALPRLMASTGFRARDDERLPFFVQAAGSPLGARLASAEGWFLTRGDFDVE
jgi:hypothetical protein